MNCQLKCRYVNTYAGQTKCFYAMKLSLSFSLSVCECMRERERKWGSVPFHDPQVFWTVFEFFLFTLFCGCPLYCLLLLLSLCRHKRQQLSSLKHKNIFRKKNSFKYQTKTCSLNRKKRRRENMVGRTEYPKFAAYAAYKLIESRPMSTCLLHT